VCETCFPATEDGHFAIDPTNSKRCEWHQKEEPEPIPECTANEYYKTEDNSCYPCGRACVTCADETGTCNECLPNSAEGTYTVSQTNPKKCDFTETPQPECNEGTYYSSDQNACVRCGTDCKRCADETGECLECVPDTVDRAFFVSPNQPKKCEWNLIKPECTDTQYYDGASNTCISCGENCARCEDNTGHCTECVPAVDGSYTIMSDHPKDCQFIPRCSDGEYLTNANACASCGQNCLRCSDGNGACQKCAADTVVDSRNFACEVVPDETARRCPAGEYYDPQFDFCWPCWDNCADCKDNTGECDACKDGFMASWDGFTCTPDDGSGGNNSNDWDSSDTTWTIICPDGQYASAGGFCMACGINCDMCEDTTA